MSEKDYLSGRELYLAFGQSTATGSWRPVGIVERVSGPRGGNIRYFWFDPVRRRLTVTEVRSMQFSRAYLQSAGAVFSGAYLLGTDLRRQMKI